MNLTDALINRKYAESTEILNQTNNVAKLKALSLIYRLQDDYDAEKEIVIKGLESKTDPQYMQQRKEWHNLPRHQKMVARKMLELPKKPHWIPPQQTIDQLCFVTIGGGKRPFRDMVECLESLRNTPTYKNHPIYIVDTGLDDYQREFLNARIGIESYFNPAKLFPQWPEKQQSWLSIAYFPTFFPGYRYHFHLECDTWIQDERSIDKYLVLAEQQGWAMDGWNVGIYCIDAQSGYTEQWIEKTGENSLIMEKTGNQIYRQNKLQFLKDVDQSACPNYMFERTRPAAPIGLRNNSMVWHTGIPFLDHNGVLIDHLTLEPVGIFHCHKPCEYIRALRYKVLTKSISQQLTQQQWEYHIERSREQLATGPESLCSIDSSYTEIISMRYRTFPWKNKNQLRADLVDQAKLLS